MAEVREPPPLFDDDDISKKDEESDIFASAVQSPMSEEINSPINKDTEIPHPLAEPISAPNIVEFNGPKDSQPDLEKQEAKEKVVQEENTEAKTESIDQVREDIEKSSGGGDNTNIGINPSGTEPNLICDITEAAVSTKNELNPLDVESHPLTGFLNESDTTEILLHDTSKEISLLDDDDDDDNTLSATLPYTPEQDMANIDTTPSIPHPSEAAPFSPTYTGASASYETPTPKSSLWEEQKEKDDSFIEITISDPQKIGDGMGSYMAYKVTTKTNIKYFRKQHWGVTRRFSDFLGLHSKLVDKYLHAGVIVPPAPEKAAIASTKMKLSSDKSSDSGQTEFLERRRAALERYMNRTSLHPTLRLDPDFREFLELDAELPKATQTSAMSSAGVMRLFNRVGETVNKMTFKMEESDQWFEEKTNQIESLDIQLRKLHFAMEGLVGHRRELAHSTANFSKSAAFLSSVEEHSALSRAMHQLAEATERVHSIHHAQADADFFHLTETTKDYINIVGAVKEVFHERVKTFQTWQHAQAQLSKKRENKTKAELTGRIDKVDQASEEVREWEAKVERSRDEFTRISKSIKKEMEQFDVVRIIDYKEMLIKYIEALITSQQQIIKVWETFLPEAKAIA